MSLPWLSSHTVADGDLIRLQCIHKETSADFRGGALLRERGNGGTF